MFSIQAIVQVIFGLLIFFAVVGLLYYLISIIPIPEPYKFWTLLVLKVLVVIALIGMLLDFAGYPVIKRTSRVNHVLVIQGHSLCTQSS